MTCEFSRRDDIIIDYVEGALPPYMRKKFEAHYFLCEQCFETLQAMERIILLMRRRSETIFGESMKSDAP
jgi:anti-sigma factor RsiW